MQLYTHTHTHTGHLLNKKRAILLNNNKIYLNKSAGITIISLIVTIIVLLILAGISIATLTSDNGIIKQSKSAKEKKEISEEKETIKNNGQSYPYTAYEYNGEIYYSIIYSGIADESEFD